MRWMMPALFAFLVGCAPGGGSWAVPVVETDVPSVPGTEPSPALPGNVLIVLLDDVGTDKVSAYGEHPQAPPTPTLDALAAEGVLFRNAWATPICSTSRAALLTGRYGRRYGLGENVLLTTFTLPPSELTLPEALQPAGYATAALGKWLQADPIRPGRPPVRPGRPHRRRAGSATGAARARGGRRPRGPPR